jgi:hypothetical protein
MRTILRSLALLVGAFAILLAGQVFNARSTSAAPAQLPLPVVEQNVDLAGRIEVSLPNVDENGRLLVVPPEPDPPEPVQGSAGLSLSPFEDHECQGIYEVPEGRRLTIDHVSVQGFLQGDDNAATAQLRAGIEVAIPMTATQTDGGTHPTTIDSPVYVYWAGTENVQAFETGSLGACVFVRKGAADIADTSFFAFYWSGHLE